MSLSLPRTQAVLIQELTRVKHELSQALTLALDEAAAADVRAARAERAAQRARHSAGLLREELSAAEGEGERLRRQQRHTARLSAARRVGAVRRGERSGGERAGERDSEAAHARHSAGS